MSKFQCVCGHVITTSGPIPNDDEWLFVSDIEYEKHQGTIDAEALYREFGRAYLCPVSGHIWVFRDPNADEPPTGYAPIAPYTVAPDPQ